MVLATSSPQYYSHLVPFSGLVPVSSVAGWSHFYHMPSVFHKYHRQKVLQEGKRIEDVLPSFHWDLNITSSFNPRYNITSDYKHLVIDFKDGSNPDVALLNPDQDNIESLDECSLVGNLKDDPKSMLAVVGCPGEDMMVGNNNNVLVDVKRIDAQSMDLFSIILNF